MTRNAETDLCRKNWYCFICFAGVSLHSLTLLYPVGHADQLKLNAFIIGLWAWSLVPYGVAALIAWRFHGYFQAIGWLIPTFVMDVAMHRAVFVHPQSSTASLGLLFMPLWNLLLFGPAGAILGWIFARTLRKSGADIRAG